MSSATQVGGVRVPAGASASARNGRRSAIASFAGATLEYYDFLLYATASALIFGQLFFTGPAASIASIASFGVAYAVRPLGALVFGWLGDRVGRKAVLSLTLLLMGTATFLIGCLPTFAAIGVGAPVLLLLLRCLQGISAGGEAGNASSMVIETSPDDRRGLFASFTPNGTVFGTALASAVFLLVELLPNDQLMSWGWRIPFWSSFIVTIVGFVIRRRLSEPEAFLTAKATNRLAKAPLIELFRRQPLTLLRLAIIPIFATINYMTTVFGLSYATNVVHVPAAEMLTVSLIVNFLALGSQTFYGWLSDRIGRKPVFIFGCVGSAICIFPYFAALSSGQFIWILLATALLLIVVYAAPNALYASLVPEALRLPVRVTGMSLALQIGFIIAGFAPTVAASLAGNATVYWIPAAIITVVVAIVSALAALAGRETAKVPLAELD